MKLGEEGNGGGVMTHPYNGSQKLVEYENGWGRVLSEHAIEGKKGIVYSVKFRGMQMTKEPHMLRKKEYVNAAREDIPTSVHPSSSSVLVVVVVGGCWSLVFFSSSILLLVCWVIFFEVSGVLLVQFFSSSSCSSSHFQVVFVEVFNDFLLL